MAGDPERSSGQRTVTISLDERLVKAIDGARSEPRSQWIRRAVAEKLRRNGIKVPEEWVISPDRAGKGGRPRKGVYKAESKKAVILKELEELEEKEGVRAAEGPGPGEELIGWRVDLEGRRKPLYRKKNEKAG